MTDVMARLGLRRVINASGTMTSLGASKVPPDIAAGVADVLGRFVDMDELDACASRAVAAATGAEAGIVTSSSSAAMTLAVAAALAGEDLAAIERLPDTGGRERRVAIQMGHMVNYGAPVPQAIAVAGAEVAPLGTADRCETFHLEAALGQGLAAVVHVVSHHTIRRGELPLDLVADLCRRHDVPLIVDMASEYDLRGPVSRGAAATIYSGHKFLSGPTSGIVAGTRKMIGAMLLQNRGIGRLLKVGKEGIVGAILALERWSDRDHAGERAREEAIVEGWLSALEAEPGIAASPCADWTGNPITRVQLKITPAEAGLNAWELAARLRALDPSVAVRDDEAEHQLIHLDPCNVTAAEAAEVTSAIRAVCAAARASGDGLSRTWSDEKAARGRV